MDTYKYELSIFIITSTDTELVSKYQKKVEEHNQKLCGNYSDSGFDIFMPTEGGNPHFCANLDGARFLGLGIKCAMRKRGAPCGFYLYPRSSISKTRMRLANSVGIIDAGYRGELITAVDTTGVYGSNDIHHIWGETLGTIKKFDRYFQICAPNLAPFMIQIVDSEDALGATARGNCGFGSTGV